jgi:Family of unknown function (DUF5313)
MTRVERQIRLYSRAWPMEDRQDRGDEIMSTCLDLLPEGQNWIPLTMAVNLLAGGLRARWRRRPPIWWVFCHRFGLRLPEKWRTWVFHDLTDPGWRRRMLVGKLVVLLPICLGPVELHELIYGPGGKYLSPWQRHFALMVGIDAALLGIAVMVGWLRTPKLRNRQLQEYGLRPPSESGPPWPPPPSAHPAN